MSDGANEHPQCSALYQWPGIVWNGQDGGFRDVNEPHRNWVQLRPSCDDKCGSDRPSQTNSSELWRTSVTVDAAVIPTSLHKFVDCSGR